ncbi:SdpI family protein [bacterium]|nr:SdpI family protein [bacterium]
MRKTAYFISLSIILLSFAFAFYFYPQLPEIISSHWDSNGVVNGTLGSWSIFLIPVLLTLFFFMFLFIPKLDPMKENIKKFNDHYDDFVLIFNLFMFYTFALVVIWNMGYSFNMTVGIMPGLAILFYFIGVMITKTERNYTIGIRTPWTLENDKVWEKTSKVSGGLFKIIGLSCLFLMFFPSYSFALLFSLIMFSVVFIFVYSYLEYGKLNKESKKRTK